MGTGFSQVGSWASPGTKKSQVQILLSERERAITWMLFSRDEEVAVANFRIKTEGPVFVMLKAGPLLSDSVRQDLVVTIP